MDYYILNQNPTLNPGFHHEIHTIKHAAQLGISTWIPLGYFYNEYDAVHKAKIYYTDADGCAICCPNAHRG